MDIFYRLEKQLQLIEGESNESLRKIKNIQRYINCRLKHARRLLPQGKDSKNWSQNLLNIVDMLSEAKGLIEKIEDILPEDEVSIDDVIEENDGKL